MHHLMYFSKEMKIYRVILAPRKYINRIWYMMLYIFIIMGGIFCVKGNIFIIMVDSLRISVGPVGQAYMTPA